MSLLMHFFFHCTCINIILRSYHIYILTVVFWWLFQTSFHKHDFFSQFQTQKSLRPANRIWSRLFLCQTRGYVERDPRTIKVGDLVLEPEYKRHMPDDGKTPFVNLNRMLNVVEADFDKESLKQFMQRKIDVNDIAEQR